MSINEKPLDRPTLLLLLERFVAQEAPRESESTRFRIAPSYGINQPAPYPDTMIPFESESGLNQRWCDYVAGATYALRMVRAVSGATGIGRPPA